MRLKTHLKKCLRVDVETGESLYFKFYRPDHFATYLPTFDVAQQRAILPPFACVYCESDEDPNVLLAFSPGDEDAMIAERLDLRSSKDGA